MKVGFTGTRTGMSKNQKGELRKILIELNMQDPITEFHHGDCAGADYEANEIALNMCLGIETVAHPPTNPREQAFCHVHRRFPPKDYLTRNQSIVNCTEVLIAAPYTMEEVVRSGTWYTVRHARKKSKECIILER